jgi:hypothetical protein
MMSRGNNEANNSCERKGRSWLPHSDGGYEGRKTEQGSPEMGHSAEFKAGGDVAPKRTSRRAPFVVLSPIVLRLNLRPATPATAPWP